MVFSVMCGVQWLRLNLEQEPNYVVTGTTIKNANMNNKQQDQEQQQEQDDEQDDEHYSEIGAKILEPSVLEVALPTNHSELLLHVPLVNNSSEAMLKHFEEPGLEVSNNTITISSSDLSTNGTNVSNTSILHANNSEEAMLHYEPAPPMRGILVDSSEAMIHHLKCPDNSCPANQCSSSNQMPRIPSTSINGYVMNKRSTYFSGNWGNVLSPYWAARAMAELGGYEYIGGKVGPNTWMEFLPRSAPPRLPNKDIFQNVCRHCTSYEFFHKGECSQGWGSIAPVVLHDTRNAILQHSNRAPKEETDAIFNFFQPNDWLVYNRCVVFGHGAHAPGVLRTYDSIPSKGAFNVYIMTGRKEDAFNFCDTLIEESVEYMKQRNPAINVTILPTSTNFVDFSRLVFAPNVLVAAVGSSWALWSAVLANNNTVVSHVPVFDVNNVTALVEHLPKSVHFLMDVPTLQNPESSEETATGIGIPFGKFSNTSEAREAVLRYFRNAR